MSHIVHVWDYPVSKDILPFFFICETSTWKVMVLVTILIHVYLPPFIFASD